MPHTFCGHRRAVCILLLRRVAVCKNYLAEAAGPWQNPHMTDTPSKPPKRGAVALKRVIKPQFKTADLARAVGVDAETIRRWSRGDSEPDAVQMAKLEDLGVCEMRAWSEPDSGHLPTADDSAPASGDDDNDGD